MLKLPDIFLFLLLAGGCNIVYGQTTDAAEDNNADSINTGTSGSGVIIELEPQTDTPATQATDSTQNKHPIQIIVGGQGKDGVAKQSTLPVDD